MCQKLGEIEIHARVRMKNTLRDSGGTPSVKYTKGKGQKLPEMIILFRLFAKFGLCCGTGQSVNVSEETPKFQVIL